MRTTILALFFVALAASVPAEAQISLDDAARACGEQPTLDFGLAALARVLNLPPGAALALFALGRTVGWIGHAIEQYQLDRLIRPRARYVGAPPVTG